MGGALAPRRTMLIAQLTDLHAVTPGDLLDGVDTNAMLARAVSHLGELSRPPDVVLITGDLAECGNPAAYQALRCRLEALSCPWFVTVGNHDSRDALRQAFGTRGGVPASGFVCYAIEDLPVRLVALDTLDVGRGGGALCAERLQWLARTLSQAPERPTLVFMHHPPFETGIDWMDASRFDGASEFAEILSRHRQVQLIICGHLHRPIVSQIAGIPVSVAPSTCYQVHLDLVPAASPHIILEPPACHLHLWDGCRFITHQSYIASPVQPIDLCKIGAVA